VEGLLSETQQNRGIFSNRIEQHRALAFSHHFAQNMNAFGLELPEMS
jgi:hypothetical protein